MRRDGGTADVANPDFGFAFALFVATDLTETVADSSLGFGLALRAELVVD